MSAENVLERHPQRVPAATEGPGADLGKTLPPFTGNSRTEDGQPNFDRLNDTRPVERPPTLRRQATLTYVPPEGKEKRGYYLLRTPGGHDVRLTERNSAFQALMSEIVENAIDLTQAMGPVELGTRVIGFLKERGIRFEGGINEAYDLLDETLDRWLKIEEKRIRGFRFSVIQSGLKNLSQKIGVDIFGWLRLNPAEREAIATFNQGITAASLAEVVDDEAVVTSKRIRDIHNNLKDRLGWVASLGRGLGEFGEGVVTPIGKGLGALVYGTKETIIDMTQRLPEAAGKGIGGLLGGGAGKVIGEFQREKEGNEPRTPETSYTRRVG